METSEKFVSKKSSSFLKLFAAAALAVTAAGALSGCYIERGPYHAHGYNRPRGVIVVR